MRWDGGGLKDFSLLVGQARSNMQTFPIILSTFVRLWEAQWCNKKILVHCPDERSILSPANPRQNGFVIRSKLHLNSLVNPTFGVLGLNKRLLHKQPRSFVIPSSQHPLLRQWGNSCKNNCISKPSNDFVKKNKPIWTYPKIIGIARIFHGAFWRNMSLQQTNSSIFARKIVSLWILKLKCNN